jgi:DNA-binding winged helix-turn-helix (wHTH) protein
MDSEMGQHRRQSTGWMRTWLPGAARRIARFGAFELDVHAGELKKAGRRVNVQDQPLQVLLALLDEPGQVVLRDDLRHRLWPADRFVDFEHGLNAAVKRLRDGLGDSAEAPTFVETVPRRGYRFIAPVQWAGAPPRRRWLRPAAYALVAALTIAAATCASYRLGHRGRGSAEATPARVIAR